MTIDHRAIVKTIDVFETPFGTTMVFVFFPFGFSALVCFLVIFGSLLFFSTMFLLLLAVFFSLRINISFCLRCFSL